MNISWSKESEKDVQNQQIIPFNICPNAAYLTTLISVNSEHVKSNAQSKFQATNKLTSVQ